MKFTLALAAISAAVAAANPFAPAKSANNAKASYASKLMRNAKVVRSLEQADEEFEVDISGYSIKFEKCQFVKSYDDELAEEEDSETVLATKRFVVFRLCPTGYCSSCNVGYGEYIVDLESYLEATVEYQQEQQQEMCNACQECGNWNQDGENQEQDQGDENANRRLQQYYNVDCDSCYDECMKIENMEENGYIDATNFLDCQMVYDPEDDGNAALYAGPTCASNGSKIKIGVFTDENCNMLDSSKDVDDYLFNDNYQMKLSHALLKTVYAEDTCVSCLMPEEEDENQDQNQDENAEEQEAEVLDMCQQLYEAAGKCEQAHGFDNGYSGYYDYENQLAQEEVVCDFIESISMGSYDESGEIVVNGGSTAIGGGAETTMGQKFALFFFIAGTIALAGYAAMLHSKLTKGSSAGLADQGGAMA